MYVKIQNPLDSLIATDVSSHLKLLNLINVFLFSSNLKDCLIASLVNVFDEIDLPARLNIGVSRNHIALKGRIMTPHPLHNILSILKKKSKQRV